MGLLVGTDGKKCVSACPSAAYELITYPDDAASANTQDSNEKSSKEHENSIETYSKCVDTCGLYYSSSELLVDSKSHTYKLCYSDGCPAKSYFNLEES